MGTRLSEAFKQMRREGLIARQNFSCCGSCGGYEIAQDVEKMLDAGKPAPKGCCFYHRQDAEALKEPRAAWGYRGHEKRTMMLRYGQIGSQKYGDVGLPTEEVGKIVVEALRSSGVGCEWDGNPDRCIEIDVDSALDEMPVVKVETAKPEATKVETAKPEATVEVVEDVEGCVPGTRIPLPRVKLVGSDGNAFAIMGKVREALRKARVPKPIEERFLKESTSGDYSKVIATAMRYAEVS